MADREDFQRVLLTKHDMKSNEMSSVCVCVCWMHMVGGGIEGV